ncbi:MULTISPECIES: UPF0149 family protein [Burkholderiaceae]|uniref:Protein export cytoplasm protein SecA ATPase RNA helicase n=1 Tax=Caballeronia sordidicola TaxID=196367 RepID=A0A242MBS8_CABSO|nr:MULTISPECIES: UPF0149 family protein [Burkholderiaceae]OTP68754.1 Protein export cytoplasm protein SecA ATPase RNA helicase [Caballeronia sordidicola]
MNNMFRMSDDEIDQLDQFLMSEFTSDETMMIDSLDGYLTAIAIGPVTLMPSEWIPGIWGPSPEDEPAFESVEQTQHIFNLVFRHFNNIVSTFERDPESIAPLFNINRFDDHHEYLDAESWAHGFMRAIDLRRSAWQPLFDDARSADWLRPLYLLGADDVSEEDELLVRSPAQREQLSEQIPDRIVSIYRYWLPYRHAVHERHLATTIQRTAPKIGRNDQCPCSSGKKFKKCCGTASILH